MFQYAGRAGESRGEPDEFQNRSVSIWSFIMGPILMLAATFSVDLERRFAMLQIDTEGSSPKIATATAVV